MRISEQAAIQAIVRAYIGAYTATYGSLWNSGMYERLSRMMAALSSSPQLLMYFQFPCISSTLKTEQIKTILEAYDLMVPLRVFCTIVILRGHAAHLHTLLQHIIRWYEQMHNIVHVEITLAQEPSAQQKHELTRWAQGRIQSEKLCITYHINPALLAGIRIETEGSIAEYSVRKQLRRLSQLCKHEDIIWR